MKNQNKSHSILEVVLMVLVLLFTAIGCERRLAKSPESTEQIKSLHEAAADGDIEEVKLLISKGYDVNKEDEEKMTPLHYATETGKMEVVQLLVEAGAEVNAGKNDWPPLCIAVYKNNIAVAEYLIAHGADVNAPVGWTPLQEAAGYSSVEMVELLIDKGAEINSGPLTALHCAAKFGNKNVAEYLITRGADINAKDKEGHTPLYIAVHHDYKVAELLIDKGADGNIKTESGQTLFQLAKERKSIESTVPDMIFDGEPNTAFGVGIACGDIDGDGYDDILIGAGKYGNQKGRVYLFYGGPDMDTTCDLIFEGETEGDLFGTPVSCGDIDNDGYDDILIGASKYSNNQGRAYLYWGSKRNSMDANPDKIFDGEAEEGARFSLGCPGPVIYDIDNDGYLDIIISAVWYHSDHVGRAYLYYGSTKELMDTSYDLIFTSENSGDNLGAAIGCGDVDNDGYADLIIGARFHPGGGLKGDRIGRAYLYYGGSRSNIDAKADEIFDAESSGRNVFGQGIVCHDFNNDGHDDIVIGAQGYNGRQGRAYLFYGDTRANLDTVADKTFDGEMEYSDYGFAVICGDIDGDDNTDIVIGADFIRQRTGRVYVYWGSELSGLSPKPGRIFTGENPAEWFSSGMACGDVNNDGYDDLVIGAKGYKAGSEQGQAYLYYGGPKN